MAQVRIDPKKLVEFLKEELDFDDRKAAIQKLKKIDWNPFDDDGDEHVGAWAEMKHNGELISNAACAIVGALEIIVIEGVALNQPQKKKIAVELLDDMLKLPFFLEPFDQIAIGMFVDAAVNIMKGINWGIAEGEDHGVIPAPAYVYKEIG